MATSYVTDQDGHAISFDQIYNTYFQDIFNYVLRRVGNVADAEDLTSQTFFKALRGIQRFRWRGIPLSAWLYRIATNEVNGFFRRGSKRGTQSLANGPMQTDMEGDAVDLETRNAEAELLRYETFLSLQKSLFELKPADQSLLALRYFEQLPFSEIATILGKRQGTVIMRTRRALEKLKHLLERRGIDYERFRESIGEPGQTGYSGSTLQAAATS